MIVSGIKKLRIEYEDKTLVLQGDQLELWKKNLSTMLHWAALHNYNLFNTYPVQYEQLGIANNYNAYPEFASNPVIKTTDTETPTDEVAVAESQIKKAKKATTK